MTTVIDQASPWLSPSATLAATMNDQLGATAISNGTGSASTHPSTSSRRLPTRSASAPAARFVNALLSPNATMNERTAALEESPNSSLPTNGSVDRSRPTIAPTKALIATSNANWAAFSRRPRRTSRGCREMPERNRSSRSRCVTERSARLARADGRTHRAELLRLSAGVLEGRPRIGVNQVPLFDVREPERHQLARMLSFQESSGNSPGPEVDVALSLFRDLAVDDDVG